MIIKREYIEGELQVTEFENGTVLKVAVQSEVPVTLEDTKKQKLKELQQSYYSSFTTFQSSALGSVKTYPFDSEAQKNFNDYQNRLIADPNKDTFYFKTIEDGTLILHNRMQFLQVLEDAEMFKVNQTIKLNELINQVNTAYNNSDQAGIEAIVW